LWRQLEVSGASQSEIEDARRIFAPNVLTLGFARRFAAYKRPNLLLHDPDRLLRILTDTECPVQLIVAGKAHPEDKEGQAMIQQWISFIRRPETRKHVVFLSDYDMLLTASLVQGVDVWINTPRRPWEACGTSGMKVLVNGGINLSELDGWWAEAYTPEVGWAIGDGREHGDDPAWDRQEAESMYTILESEVIPQFYNRNEKGIPMAWVALMRESMANLTPVFSANRTMREYTERYYVPAASAYKTRAADKGKVGIQVVKWQQNLARKWADMRFGPIKIETHGGRHRFNVQIYLGEMDPDSVRVELYAEVTGGGKGQHQAMTRGDRLVGVNSFNYSAEVPCSSPATDYTVRIIPYHEGVAVPLEANYILWER